MFIEYSCSPFETGLGYFLEDYDYVVEDSPFNSLYLVPCLVKTPCFTDVSVVIKSIDQGLFISITCCSDLSFDQFYVFSRQL
ncbi:MAG: hypothetical protein QXN10_06175 [Desulfurococcaceae archaeon]